MIPTIPRRIPRERHAPQRKFIRRLLFCNDVHITAFRLVLHGTFAELRPEEVGTIGLLNKMKPMVRKEHLKEQQTNNAFFSA